MYMLVVVEMENERDTDWSMFLGALEPKWKRAKNTDRLAQNVWLADMRKDSAFLGWLISLCDQRGIPFRLLPIEKEPVWLPEKP
jgi:hypothetical protein